MESRVLWFTVMCILCRDAISESTPKIFTSINDTLMLNTEVNETKNAQIERLVEMQSKSLANISKNNLAESEISQEFPMIVLYGFRRTKCSRYCIGPKKLGSDEDDPTENINLFLTFNSFAGNMNKAENFLLEGSPNLKISRYIPVNRESKNATNLNNCEIYLNLGCGVENTDGIPITRHNKFVSNSKRERHHIETLHNLFRRDVSRFFSKELVRKTDLSGYTETKFHIDPNVSEIVINIWGNLKRIVLVIPTNRTMFEPGQMPGVTISLARTYDAKGVAFGARNLLQGGWYVKLTGAPNSNYHFNVVAYFDAREKNNTMNEVITDDVKFVRESTSTLKFHDNTAADQTHSLFLSNILVNEKPKSVFERSAEITDSNSNDKAMVDNLTDESLESTRMEGSFALINRPSKSYEIFKIPQNAPYKEMTADGKILAQQQQKIQTRSSEVGSLNENIDTNVKIFAANASLLTTNSDSIQEHSEKLSWASKDGILGKQKTPIEVNANTNLLATPGTIHRVVFDVTNNCDLLVKYALRVTSSPFRINYIEPSTNIWLTPGQTGQVIVSILVPPTGISGDTVNKLTLSIVGTEIPEKTVYIYVRDTLNNRNIDDTKPTIEYSFNSNCAGKLNKDRCEKTLWSTEITIQDSDSGLKSVTSTPNAIYPRTEFVSGTKSPVTFYYISTCCSTTATITAIDVLNNQHTRKIDVTEWDNLSQGEIAAIVVGALFLLLLLILFIVAIVLCVRRRNGHDLPYTQRYGSRPPARSERTSF